MYFPNDYASTTSRTSAGQAFAQIPQAIHLLLTGESSALTITPNGQASTHLPQSCTFFLIDHIHAFCVLG